MEGLEASTIRTVLLLFCFALLFVLYFFRKQNAKINWATFFAFLWQAISLGLVNYASVSYNLWYFPENTSSIGMPLDLFFIWLVFWAVIPVYFFKGKYPLILALLLFWLDLILMPLLEPFGILVLDPLWLLGEIALVLFVWLPSYLWAKAFIENRYLWFRAVLQCLVMGILLTFLIPALVLRYTNGTYQSPAFDPYYFQIIFMIAFPGLVAVQQLVQYGKGTPFPYDPTQQLVQRGVYAYCKNPIQWSFTVVFIPLAFFYTSYLLLAGALISIAYSLGVSNPQEYEDMKNRFGTSWQTYKQKVPSWYFSWRPKHLPEATIYFKRNCSQCEQIKKWFANKNTSNLHIQYADTYPGEALTQVTYVPANGSEEKSVAAIGSALEHLYLSYACLGWFMKFPIIRPLLQLLVDSMGLEEEGEDCSLPK